MMGSDDCEQVACSAEVALEILGRAYHALAVVYELSIPGAYTTLHDTMMPYLRDGFATGEAPGAAGPHTAETVSAALDRVRRVLDAVGSDVAAIRPHTDLRDL